MKGGLALSTGEAPPTAPTTRAIRRIIGQLVEEYEWQAPDLAEFTARVKERLGDEVSPKLITRIACIVHYEDLYDAIASGGQRRKAALDELFTIHWHEGVDGAPDVHYRGYLFRSAYVLLRQRVQNAGQVIGHDELTELAAHAGASARMSVERNFHQVRGRASFWGWLAQVLRHEALHELTRFQREPEPGKLADDEHGKGSGEVAVENTEMVTAVLDELQRKARLKRISGEQVYILHYDFSEDMSNIEIAERLTARLGRRVTPGHVAHEKHAALTVLRNNLRESGLAI